MYPFFETIRYYQGIAENLVYHQQRVDRTFALSNVATQLQLAQLDFNKVASAYAVNTEQIYKCRVSYNLEGNYEIVFEPYTIRNIQSFELFDIGENGYDCKFSNRNWINAAKTSVSADEVIFTKSGLLKDASYANIVLFDGQNWVTPANPLLLGTRRASLLLENLIIEKEINVHQLKDFQLIKFINAMMLWEESPCISVNPLNLML